MNVTGMAIELLLGLLLVGVLLRQGAVLAEQRRILSSIQRALEAMPGREAADEARRQREAGTVLLAAAAERLEAIEAGLAALRPPPPAPPPPLGLPGAPLPGPLPGPLSGALPSAPGPLPLPRETGPGGSLLEQLEEIRRGRLAQAEAEPDSTRERPTP
jgi:hypothetical protein